MAVPPKPFLEVILLVAAVAARWGVSAMRVLLAHWIVEMESLILVFGSSYVPITVELAAVSASTGAG
jgi:hypothetical protein